MKFVAKEDGMRVPLKSWCTRADLDEKTMEQLIRVSSLPFAFKHVAAMPDAHMGYGASIGTVVATQGAVVPNIVGVDIGCGMAAKRTNISMLGRSTLEKIVKRIRDLVPTGINSFTSKQHGLPIIHLDKYPLVEANKDKAARQIGTLGGGNHFIEIQKGSDGFIWIMVHSGSRGLGHRVASFYNKLAQVRNQQWYSSVDPSWDLAYLPFSSEEGRAYIREMDYCIEYARINREAMISATMLAIAECLFASSKITEIDSEDTIQVPHNYAAMEHHFKQNVFVHRKGASRAREGDWVIIPGSQGTKSYICKGKGDATSFCSSSHGAGRRLGRRQAKRELDLDEQRDKMDTLGIVHTLTSIDALDEAPDAYKDIEVVMHDQQDLVSIEVELTPLASIKA